jgi:hypothetical protein
VILSSPWQQDMMFFTMQWNELLQEINAIHLTTFELSERYTTGEQGAFAIVDQEKRRGVLKWTPGTQAVGRLERARAVTDRLREGGYPAPRYLYIGKALRGTYSIQLALSGFPLPLNTTAEYLPRLLELNAMQVGQALPGLPDWHQEAVNTVLFGGEGYCLHSSLHQYSPGTATLLSDLQRLVSAHQDTPHQRNDVVHGDFQHANILAHDHQITGVVDWDAVYAGDCIFDIATLLFYSYDDQEVREQLWRYALERASFRLLSVYLAHLILRQVDWSLRYHDQGTIGRYLNRGSTLLVEMHDRFKRSR